MPWMTAPTLASCSHTAVLEPFPGTICAAVQGLTVDVAHTADQLSLRFSLAGRLADLLIPPERPKSFRDGLWKYTCFEAFLTTGEQPAYLEYNFSPSGEWAAYAFSAYRQGTDSLMVPEPVISVSREQECHLSASIDVRGLGPGLRLGLSAVVEACDGTLTYWALAHPSDRPDFHHRGGFVLALAD